MQDSPITVLLIDHDAEEVDRLSEALREADASDITLVRVAALAKALALLDDQESDAVLVDLRSPGATAPDGRGLEGLESLVRAAGEIPVIVCSTVNDQAIAQEAIRRGAQDYLVRTPKLYAAVPRILRHTVERSRIMSAANRRIELARHYSEVLLGKVISVADSGLAVADQKGIFHIVNPALAELKGTLPSKLIGQPWTSLLPARDRDQVHEAFVESLNRGGEYGYEAITIEREDGSTVELALRSVFLTIGNNEPCRVLSFDNPFKSGAFKSGRAASVDGESATEQAQVMAATAVPGCFQVVGLQILRAELGSRWPAVAARVNALAGATISEQIAPGDSFMRYQDGNFIICFGGQEELEARRRTREICGILRKRILEADSSGLLEGRQPEGQEAGIAEAWDEIRKSGCIEPENVSIETASSGSRASAERASAVTDVIAASAGRMHAATQAMIEAFQTSCRARLRKVYKRDRGAAPFVFHDFDSDTRAVADRLMAIAGRNPQVMAEIDFIALGNAVQRIYDLGSIKLPLIAVEVHFSTLADRALRERYLSICQSLDTVAISSLVLKIRDLPSGLTSAQLAAATAELQPYSRLRMLQVTKLSLRDLNLKTADIALVVVDHCDILNSYYRDPRLVQAFAIELHAKGVRIVVDRVTSANGGHLFRDLNVDFISHEAARSLVA